MRDMKLYYDGVFVSPIKGEREKRQTERASETVSEDSNSVWLCEVEVNV